MLVPLSRPWTARMSLLTRRRAMPMPRSWCETPRGAASAVPGSMWLNYCYWLRDQVPGDRMHQLLPLRGSVCDLAAGTSRSCRRTSFNCGATVAQVLWRPGRGARREPKQFESDSLTLAASLDQAGESLLQEVRRHDGSQGSPLPCSPLCDCTSAWWPRAFYCAS